MTSPTLTAGINAILKELPGAKWHQYEVGGRHSAYKGAMLAFGRPVNTIYNFSQADVIVSLDADFLACGPGNLRHARQFADKRRVQTNVTHTPQPKEDWQEGYQEGSIPRRAPINPRHTRRKIAGRWFCRRRCRRKESRPARR